MRWMWIDRFTEFVSGSHASGIKNIALDEDALDDYCPGYPHLPPTLIIEGMAQLGGILVAEMFQWDKQVVLAKVGSAEFFYPASPGDQLQYRVVLESAQDNGAVAVGTSHRNGVLQANIQLMFAFLEKGRFSDGPLFKPGDLSTMLRLMKFFHVAVDADGKPIEISSNL